VPNTAVSPHPSSNVNKTTSLKTKTKTKITIGKTKTKTTIKVGKSNTKNKTNVIAADNVIVNGKVAIIVSLQHNILYVFSVFHYNFLCVVCM